MGTKVKCVMYCKLCCWISGYEFLSFSPHPYIFFNEDRISVTFVGFKVNRTTGDLINPADNSVIEKAILSPQLVVGLEHNQVNFNEDYTTWSQ